MRSTLSVLPLLALSCLGLGGCVAAVVGAGVAGGYLIGNSAELTGGTGEASRPPQPPAASRLPQAPSSMDQPAPLAAPSGGAIETQPLQ